MTAATQQQPDAPDPAKARGFGNLPCPLCGEESVVMGLRLDDCATFDCPECNRDFTALRVRDLIAKWAPVLAWLDTAPETELE